MINSKNIMLALALLMVAGMTSCSKSDSEEAGTKEGTETNAEFIDDKGGALTAEQEQAFNKGVNDFTFNMFRTMTAEHPQTSLVSSPLSAATLLAMLNDGAWGKTREELLTVLGFLDAKTRGMNEYFQKLMDTTADDATTKLQMANAIYVRKGYEFKPAFSDDMKLYYSADAATLDFDMPETVKYINDWCSEKTYGLIPEIVKQISPNNICLLFNAIYFSGKWEKPFEKESTTYKTFIDENNKQHQVEMMEQGNSDAGFYECDNYKALRLDYEQGGYCIAFLLPNEGKKIQNIVSGLNDDTWRTLMTKFEKPEPLVIIHLPRFTIETQNDDIENLVDPLKQIGVNAMFNTTAEFPNILNTDNLFVSEIRQKAKIMVTEDGTEAAAITKTGMDGSPGPTTLDFPTFNANHPFVYIISNHATGVIYFIGTYHGE